MRPMSLPLCSALMMFWRMPRLALLWTPCYGAIEASRQANAIGVGVRIRRRNGGYVTTLPFSCGRTFPGLVVSRVTALRLGGTMTPSRSSALCAVSFHRRVVFSPCALANRRFCFWSRPMTEG